MSVPTKNAAIIPTRSGVHTVSGAGYTFTDTDGKNSLYIAAAGSDRTVTLPAASLSAGRNLFIKKTDGTFSIIIDTPGSETIDGAAQNQLNAQGSFVELECDGSNWFVKRVWDYMQTTEGSTTGVAYPSLKTITSLAVPEGRWNLVGAMNADWGSGQTVLTVQAHIATAVDTAASPAELMAGYYQSVGYNNPSAGMGGGAIAHRLVLLTSLTTYYLNARHNVTAGSSSLALQGRLTATRVG